VTPKLTTGKSPKKVIAPAPSPVVTIDDRLAELGITLPTPAAPVAAYVPTVEANDMLFVSGQLPFKDGRVVVGRLGEDINIDHGRDAARACAIMILAQMKTALGSLDRVERIVKLNIFVNSDARFTDQPKVGDGASTLMVEVFGDAGRHARAAVGVPALPLGAAVEVDAIVAIRPA
jgi:enamine deaminase RidA (YjgF/YER057c/UK114 family)